MSGTSSFSNTGIKMQYLNQSAIPRSPYTQKMNPIFAGLITPPESPIRYVQRDSLDTTAAHPPALSILEANPALGSTNGVYKSVEALSVAIRNASAEQDANVPGTVSTSTSVTPIDFSNASEIIHSIIEQAVEEKMANAMGPLRLNINRLDDSLESIRHREDALRRETTDIRDQNDTMSRQLDLHYRTVEQHVEEFRSQSKTMNTMIGAQADNFAATINMVNHLSQVVTNLPLAINQVVHNAVQQQTQLAIRDIMFAQQQAMFSVSDVSRVRQSVSSDGSSSQCTCNHHCLEIESMASTQHGSGSLKHISPNASPKSNRSFKLQFIANCLLHTFKMGAPELKTTPKKNQTAALDRRTPSKVLKSQRTPKVNELKTPGSTPSETAYTHNLPTGEQKKGNGRVTGRRLIMWNRPRMTEKLLLHIHYECVRHKVNIPWDAISHRLHPGSSGQAILQHVNRLRKELFAEGHMVPPPAHKNSPSTPYDPTVRGYVRDPTSDDKRATRSVGFDEKLDDAKMNLPDAFDAMDEGEDEFFLEANGDELCTPEADDNVIALEDDIPLPVTPTLVRHAAPRPSVSASATQYSLNAQNIQQDNVAATQQLDLFDNNLFADITPPNFVLNSTEGLQPMGVQNPIAFTNEAQLLMGGANLFDPFTTQPLVKPSHEQISPCGQSPLGKVPNSFFMGNPYNFQSGGFYNNMAQPNFMAQSNFMAQPPFGFAMPPTPPALFNPEDKEEPQSSPAANEHRGISVSPVSSPVAAQLPTFQPETLQPEIESPEQQLDEATPALPFSDDFVGHDLLLQFLATAE
ncbi:hypothetical protein H0G86_008429 [Trichoderma simmonsii]|uniref:Myb-like domain-containing protein n=1 Tax=Trichoderma simmonsii TaxID=1491479 RepID=A0A8G0PI37_9HYPO|nr:hypothetical protein H0G86_008429 [Trichoderma simmonsii]